MAIQWNTTCKLLHIPKYTINCGAEVSFIGKTEQQQKEWFESFAVANLEYTEMSYIRITGGNIRVKGNCDEITAKSPNWLMFQNADFGNKWFYANIVSINYVNAELTDISYTVNSFQTYCLNLEVGSNELKSFVARRTWNKGYDDMKKIAQLPLEDLDVGKDYITCDINYDFNDTDGNYQTEQFYYLLLTKPLLSSGNTHNINTGEKSFSYISNNTEKTFTASNGINSVLYGYIMNYACLNACLNKGLFSEDCSIVNALMFLVQLPFGRSLFPSSLVNDYKKISTETNPSFGESLPETSECYDQGAFGNLQDEVDISYWCSQMLDYHNKQISDTTAYTPYVDTTIGYYLLKYPYSLLEVYDFFNQPNNIAIDSLNKIDPYAYIAESQSEHNDNKTKLPLYKYASIGQNPMMVYNIANYMNNGISNINTKNTMGNITNVTSSAMETVQASVTLPIISDYLASFLQANQNQINATRTNLRATLQTEMNNAGASLQASGTSIALSRRASELSARTQADNARLLTNAQMRADLANLRAQNEFQQQSYNLEALQGLGQFATGAVGGAMLGGLGGAVAGGAMGAFNMLSAYKGAEMAEKANKVQQQGVRAVAQANNIATANTYQAAMQIAMMESQAAMAQAQAAYGNAVRSASTEYHNQIRMLNSRIEDASNVPPSVQSMGNNASLFNTMFNRDMIKFTAKTLPPTVIERLINYWSMYGFLTNQLEKVGDIITRVGNGTIHGIYIMTVNFNVQAQANKPIPNDHILNIKALFDGGVHLWEPTTNNEGFLNFDLIREA